MGRDVKIRGYVFVFGQLENPGLRSYHVVEVSFIRHGGEAGLSGCYFLVIGLLKSLVMIVCFGKFS